MTANKRSRPRPKKRQSRHPSTRDLAGAEQAFGDSPPAEPPIPSLRFSPYAWSKLLFLRDLGETEVGGFGISSADDLFLIEDFVLVGQTCTWASVSFDDEAVADFYDEQVDWGRHPEQFSRCWIHTHPGDSAQPSGKDEDTFARVFGDATWSVMFILARGGETYARLKFGCGPGAQIEVPVAIAWEVPFAGAEQTTWEREYAQCVAPAPTQRERETREHCQDLYELEPVAEGVADWDLFAAEDFEDPERSLDGEF